MVVRGSFIQPAAHRNMFHCVFARTLPLFLLPLSLLVQYIAVKVQ